VGSIPEVSVIIPAYNEEKSISRVLSSLKTLPKDYEIIAVDDGSDDNTAEIIKGFSEVKLIQQEHNLGYGAALKKGVMNAKGDIVVIIDADGTYPSEQIQVITNSLNEGKYSMVVGARTSKNVNVPLIRKPAKWCISKLANYLVGMAIPDINSGLRVMKKCVVERFLNILPDGFSFTTTITLAMLTNNYPVKFIPIDYYKREGQSKIRPIRDTLNFIQLILRTTVYFNPLKVFVPFSLSLILLAFVVLIGSLLFLEKTMDVTFGVIIMTAIIVLTVGILADLIDKRLQ
jgi:glycosyltransferase involved in cell wall biosynthesis